MTSLQIMLLKVFAVLALVVGLMFAWQAHEHTVFNDGYQKAVADRKAHDDANVLSDIIKAADGTAGLLKASEGESRKRIERNMDYEKGFADARARAASGNSRMRVPIDPGVCRQANAAPESTGPSSGPPASQDAALLPRTALVILDAARNSARDVRDYNALMGEFKRCQAAANAP